MSPFLSVVAVGIVLMCLPSLNTETLSDNSKISESLWEM